MSDTSLSIPGIMYVAPSDLGTPTVLHVGPAVGWVALSGIHTWTREISVVMKADLGETLCKELGVALPENRPEAQRLSGAKRAAVASSLVAVDGPLIDKLVAKGVRVHTIGADRATGGFYYFAQGGASPPVRAQANLVEMIAPSLGEKSDNAAVDALLDGLVARFLAELSEGQLSEAQIELAGALPVLGEPADESRAKLETLEGRLMMGADRASRYEERARAAVEAVGAATRKGEDKVATPLFTEARRVAQAELEVEFADGEAGTRRRLTLPERSRWFVTATAGEPRSQPSWAPRPIVDNAAAERATAEKAAAEKAAAEKAAAEKAAAEKAAAERRAAAERAAAEKQAADKAAAEKQAALEKAAAERVAADKAAAEKKAALEKAAAENAAREKAAAEKAAADKAAAEKKAALEKAAAEKVASDAAAAEKRVAAEKAAAEKAAAERAAAERDAAEKASAGKAASEKAAAEKAIAEEWAAAKAIADEKAAAEKAEAERRAAEKAAAKKKMAEARNAPTVVTPRRSSKGGKKKGARPSERPKAAAVVEKARPADEEKRATKPAPQKSSAMMYVIAALVLAFGGALAYYFLVVKPGG